MFLHLFNDEKFVDAAIQHFEDAAPSENFYLILVRNKNLQLNFVKTRSTNLLALYYKDFDAQLSLIKEFKLKAILVHYLTYEKAKIVLQLKKNNPLVKIVWFFWGEDGFSLQKFEKLLFQKKTKNISSGYKAFIKDIIKKALNVISVTGIYLKDLQLGKSTIIKAIKNSVDFIVPVIPEDYFLLVDKYPTKAKLLEWNYLSIDQMLGKDINQEISGNNILLGNSASKTNNHIEIIDKLSLYNLSDRKVYVPLNYGDPNYRDYIVKYGEKKLGRNFHPLIDFLPLTEYNKILLSCGIVIMNHNRQQGMGNIIATIWMGSKIYLNKQNTVYSFLKKIGVKIFTIEEDLNKALEGRQSFEEAVKKENKKALLAYFGEEKIREKTRNLLKELTK